MTSRTNKVAIVTGASRGIGAAVADRLAADGFTVVINYSSDTKSAEALARKIEGSGGRALPAKADVSDVKAVRGMFDAAEAAFGGVDVLVYNTGSPKSGTFGELNYADWEEATKLLLLSAVTLTQKVLPHMKSRKWGRLVYITSLTLRQPIANLVLSNTVRLGIAGLSKSLSKELAPHGITSNGIIQGYVRTERMVHLIEERASKTGTTVEEAYKELVKSIPLGRYGEPEEVGYLAAFIASERGSYLTGGMFTVDGGVISSVF